MAVRFCTITAACRTMSLPQHWGAIARAPDAALCCPACHGTAAAPDHPRRPDARPTQACSMLIDAGVGSIRWHLSASGVLSCDSRQPCVPEKCSRMSRSIVLDSTSMTSRIDSKWRSSEEPRASSVLCPCLQDRCAIFADCRLHTADQRLSLSGNHHNGSDDFYDAARSQRCPRPERVTQLPGRSAVRHVWQQADRPSSCSAGDKVPPVQSIAACGRFRSSRFDNLRA